MRRLFVYLWFGVFLTSSASASLLKYTESLTASGVLGSASFSNAPVTLSVIANTNDIDPQSHASFITVPLVTVDIGGLGTYTISGADGNLIVVDYHFSALGLTSAGFKDASFGVFTSNAIFDSYYLGTPIGPVSGDPDQIGGSVATSGGTLAFTDLGASSTFQAAVAPAAVTPEPTSLLLVGTGLAALLIAGHRQVLCSR